MKPQPTQKAMSNLETVLSLLNKIDEPLLNDLYRRARGSADPDGYGSGGYQMGKTSEISDPTGTAVIRRINSEATPDPVRKTVEEIFALVSTISKAAVKLDRKIQVVLNTASSKRGRETTIDLCLACEADVTGVGEDRIRSGYCPACYRKWLRDGRPDRHRFEKSRRPHATESE